MELRKPKKKYKEEKVSEESNDTQEKNEKDSSQRTLAQKRGVKDQERTT